MRTVRCLAALAMAAAPALVRADDSTPAAQMKASMQALAAGDAKALLNSMPPAYRADAQKLVRDAVAKIDEEVWNKGFGVAKKGVKLLKDKKDLALQAIGGFAPLPPDELSKIYDGIVGILEPVVTSDLADHASAAKLDLDAFSVDVGGKQLKALMGIDAKLPGVNLSFKEMMQAMADAKIQVIKVEGDTAEIKMEMPPALANLPNANPDQTQKLKKVDGVWVDATMAEKWSETMAKANEGLAKIDFAAYKPKALKAIAAFDDAIKMIDGAKDAGGLMQAIQEAGDKIKEAMEGG